MHLKTERQCLECTCLRALRVSHKERKVKKKINGDFMFVKVFFSHRRGWVCCGAPAVQYGLGREGFYIGLRVLSLV